MDSIEENRASVAADANEIGHDDTEMSTKHGVQGGFDEGEAPDAQALELPDINRLRRLEKKLGYTFDNLRLLHVATWCKQEDIPLEQLDKDTIRNGHLNTDDFTVLGALRINTCILRMCNASGYRLGKPSYRDADLLLTVLELWADMKIMLTTDRFVADLGRRMQLQGLIASDDASREPLDEQTMANVVKAVIGAVAEDVHGDDDVIERVFLSMSAGHVDFHVAFD